MSVVFAKIQMRRGTAAEWAAANPVLAQGELAFETDTGLTKIGDGATAYASLPAYATYDQMLAAQQLIEAALAQISNVDQVVQAAIDASATATDAAAQVTAVADDVIAAGQTADVKAGEASQSAIDADASADLAAASAQAAATSAQASEDDRVLAETARTGSEAARTGAETAQGLAEDARDDAQAALATLLQITNVVIVNAASEIPDPPAANTLYLIRA
jgi:hypothetical protein